MNTSKAHIMTTIHGSKKGSKQPHRPHIAPDTLVSQDTFKALYGLCEGEIYGLADGGKSIKLDGTPLINDNGQPNFTGVNWEFRPGTLDQSPISGFNLVENEQVIGVELRSDKAWTKAINNRELSAVRVRLNFNSLREQKDNGNVVGLTIEYAFDVQTNGGAFIEVGRFKVSGKSSSGFKRSHRIELPQSQNKSHRWTLRVRRITPNRNSDLVSDTVHIDALTEIIDAKLAYPCTALLGLSYNAKTFGNVAKIAVRLKGKIIQVPSNYNPETRTYTGLWDGTFKLAYSNNPAWVYYDICTHKRYGLGERLSGLVDKWRLYQIGQYCDELVDDGKGGREPRFAINVYIQKAEDAYLVLQNIASVFRGMSFWDGQNIVVDADTPKDPVYTFSRANVVGGEFVYQGTRARDRHTLISVAWSNPDNEYKTEYEPVADEQAIARYGIKKLDIAAWGCTSKGQAQRAGLWALKSEQLETQTVSFKTGLMGFIPQVGQVINIADDIFAGRAISGRIVSANAQAKQLTLDRQAGKVGDTITLNTGGQVQTAKIVAVNNTVLTLDKAIGQTDDVWAIISDDLKLMQFRILSITQNDDATFDITALQYERQKYDVVDSGANIIQEPLTVLKATPIQAPSSVTLTANTRTHQGQAVTTLTINWEQVTGAVAYIVEWRKDDGNWQTLPKVAGQSVDIDGVYAGQYIARVRAMDSFDNESLATSSTLTNIAGKIGRPPRLARLSVKGGLFSMDLAWTFNKGSDDTNFTEIQVSPDGRSNIAILGTFAYPTNKHEITGLQGNLTQFYRARIVDKLGNTSDWTAWVKGVTSADADKVLNLIGGQISQSHLDQNLRTPIAKIGGIESGLNGIKTQIPTINSKIGNIETGLSGITSQIPTITTNISNLKDAVGRINRDLPNINREIANSQQAITAAQNKLNTAVTNITTERNRITSAIRDISALQSANNAKTQELANLTQTVGGHTSSIRELGVTTGDLSQKYSQIKTVADKATSDITQIKQTQAGQATSIDRLDAKFDNLAVGGCNLLRNSQAERTVANATTQENFIPAYVLTKSLEPNTAYVLSYEYKTTNNAKTAQVGFVSSVGQHKFKTNLVRTSDWKRDTFKFTTGNNPNQAGYIRFDNEGTTNEQSASLWVRNVKLELGSIPSDYTPAPEDIQANIDTAKTETLANINTVRETLTNADIALGRRIDAVSAEFKQADNAIKASVQEETTARTNADAAIAQTVSALKSDYNNNKSSVASQLKTLSDKDKATASQISQITANVTTVQQTSNTANSKADDGIRRANNAQNKADTADAKATQAQADITAEQKARADADGSLARQMSALDSKFTTADNAIKASVAQAQQTATNAHQALATAQNQLNAKIDGISVGGRNLIPNTTKGNTGERYQGNGVYRAITDTRDYTQIEFATINNADDTVYTLSFWAKASIDDVEIISYFYNPSNTQKSINSQGRSSINRDGRSTFKLTTEWQKYWVTWTQAKNDVVKKVIVARLMRRSDSPSVFIASPKLETGTIATDWSPAPEDVQADINSKANTATLDEFKQAQATKDQATATKLSQIETAYKSADNNLTAKIASETTARTTADTALSQRIDSLTADYNGNKSSIASQLKTLSDKDKSTATQISQITANVTTVQQTANTANSKADTATTKADDGIRRANTASNKADTANTNAQNAKRVADDALGKATQAKADITAEQKARADGDSSLASRITALDSAYKQADSTLTSRIAREESTRANADNANAQAVSNLQSTVNGINGRVGTAESKIGTLERTTADTNQALATAQNQLNARFDNLAVGGRNLLIDSEYHTAVKWAQGNIRIATPIYKNRRLLQVFVTTSGVAQLGIVQHTDKALTSITAGETYTLSFNAQGTAGFVATGLNYVYLMREDGNNYRLPVITITTSLSRRHKISFVAPWSSNRVRLLIGANGEFTTTDWFAFHSVKLERGNVATDWTEAPEDVQSQLDEKASTATLDEFRQVQATKDQATASRITALDAAYKQADTQANAKIDSEITARTSGDSALSSRLDSLRSEFNGNKASIDAQLRTLSEKDKAQATKLSQLEASLGQKAGAAALNELTARVQNVDGKITAEIKKVATMQTTLNDQTASIRNVEQSVNGVKAIKAVTVDNNGFISGYGLMSELQNGRVTSSFGINADQIYFGATKTAKKPFIFATRPTTIDGVSYPAGAWLNSASIANATIKLAHIDKASIQSLSALSANIGHFKSANTGARLEIKDSVLLVYDANNVLRVRLGLW